MTMHLEGPWLSTTSTKKKDTKITKAKQAELEAGWRERNQRLKEMSLPKETFEQYLEWVYGRGKKTSSKKKQEARAISTKSSTKAQKVATPNVSGTSGIAITSGSSGSSTNTQGVSSQDTNRPREWITGPVASKPSPVYTGTKVLGIGTMHKSNAVPIFSDEEAIDISKMRRG